MDRRPARTPGARSTSIGFVLVLATPACGFDEATRWIEPEDPPPATCRVGELRCRTALQRCELVRDEPRWVDLQDCWSEGLVCAPSLLACTRCQPSKLDCAGADVIQCNDHGDDYTTIETCTAEGEACREGACVNLCDQAILERSNVGCEYWAVDLDNANVGMDLNAAAQQFAVVVSNPQPDLPASVTVEVDEGRPGDPATPVEVANAVLPALGLRVFRLGPREVDGSPPGAFDAGTHTALTRAAFRIASDVPIIAYQFNPLDNVDVFSNDASLLKPVESLAVEPGHLVASYVVLGWPQTLATTDDPNTTFDPRHPTNLRAFLTIVGTQPSTRVRVATTTRSIGAAPDDAAALGLPAVPALRPGEILEVTLDRFDVLNLETDDFNADFTGSVIEADEPVVVFTGSEASDAPYFDTMAGRYCCADHLEEQLDPIRTAGKGFVASMSANRIDALAAAGEGLGRIDQPEYFRIVASTSDGARLRTSLPDDQQAITLHGIGDHADLVAVEPFLLTSDAPVILGHTTPSQQAAGIVRGLPGGDPSLTIVPPIEQFRTSYVFLTPDQYAFDFIRVVAPPDTLTFLDERPIAEIPTCTTTTTVTGPDWEGLEPHVVYTCQLGFPVIRRDGDAVSLDPGVQDDGVHRIVADRPVGVLVDGFDSFVSYGYAGGTELREIVLR
ncbi:MAG: IgGFc-binding protein [Polyangiaceae bacterium]|nr:IgGFc-binding protein [Polyangiaceae bacterium]